MKDYDSNWVDHEACWKMEYRGSLGESLLHVLLICDSRFHTKLAKILIKHFPKMALDVVEGDEFKGKLGLIFSEAEAEKTLKRK